MRTARLLTVSQHALFGWVPARGVCLPRGVYLPKGIPAWGGTCPGSLPLWPEWQTGAKILPCPKLRLRAVKIPSPVVGVSGVGECLPRGCLPLGVYTTPWTEFLTDTCENITFPLLRLRTVTMESPEFFINEKLYVYEKRTVCWKQEDLLNTTYVTTVTIAKGHPATDYSLNSKAYLQRWNVRGRIGCRVLNGRFEYRLLDIRIQYRLLDGRFEYRSLVVSTFDWYAGGLPLESGILPLLKHACLKRWLVTMLAIKEVGRCRTRGETHRTHIIYTPPSGNKAEHSGFETPRRHHQKSNTGVSVAP